jgi:hypothetical protein
MMQQNGMKDMTDKNGWPLYVSNAVYVPNVFEAGASRLGYVSGFNSDDNVLVSFFDRPAQIAFAPEELKRVT